MATPPFAHSGELRQALSALKELEFSTAHGICDDLQNKLWWSPTVPNCSLHYSGAVRLWNIPSADKWWVAPTPFYLDHRICSYILEGGRPTGFPVTRVTSDMLDTFMDAMRSAKSVAMCHFNQRLSGSFIKPQINSFTTSKWMPLMVRISFQMRPYFFRNIWDIPELGSGVDGGDLVCFLDAGVRLCPCRSPLPPEMLQRQDREACCKSFLASLLPAPSPTSNRLCLQVCLLREVKTGWCMLYNPKETRSSVIFLKEQLAQTINIFNRIHATH